MGKRVTDPRDRRALLGLWAIPGIGPKTVENLLEQVGSPRVLLDLPVREWLPRVEVRAAVRRKLEALETLGAISDRVSMRVERGQMRVVFAGDSEFPALLAESVDAPPLLFVRGELNSPRRRLAMVGSRHPDAGFLPFARAFAREVAEAGIGIVSGAAEGVDRACHFGALDARGETWAFVGSALDELDPAQAKLLPRVLDGGGAFFSELPPGVRASPATFPRRNRLISGAANAVLILRAGKHSGSLHTALAAVKQQRQLLALPGDIRNDAAAGCNALIRAGRALLCSGADDALRAVGIKKAASPVPQISLNDWDLSPPAHQALAFVSATASSLEHLLEMSRWPADQMVSALCELELAGLVVQLPGKLYERV